jgi:hypothetical protein
MTIDPYDNTTWPPFSDERGDGRDPYGVHKKYCAAAPSVGSFLLRYFTLPALYVII